MENFTPHPKMAQPDQRPKPMKVLALGLSRTATISLYVALNKLGYNCYHAAEYGRDTANNSLVNWHEAIDAKYNGKGRRDEGSDFDRMLWRYDAVTDIPSVLFVDELLAAYPDAKIILTNREIGPWLASMERSFYEVLSWRRWIPLEFLDRQHTAYYLPVIRGALYAWTNNNMYDRTALATGFKNHYAHVRQISKEQGRELLEFKPQDGWGPLCKFLGKEVPEEPYPKINEGDFVAQLHYQIFFGGGPLLLGWER